jgi:hypothetical protein
MNREAHRIEVLCLQGCPHAEETIRDELHRRLELLFKDWGE